MRGAATLVLSGKFRKPAAAAPANAKAAVKAKVVGMAKGPKIDGFTYKKRTNQRRRYGHRQKYHVIEITSIKKG